MKKRLLCVGSRDQGMITALEIFPLLDKRLSKILDNNIVSCVTLCKYSRHFFDVPNNVTSSMEYNLMNCKLFEFHMKQRYEL